jgi:Arf-GAP/coiled-coil/ANK repeat/PH domain-containing protein
MEPKPPGSPAKTPWKGVRLEKLAINLTDAMEDSPIFRDKIKREEEGLDELCNRLKKLVKVCRQVKTSGQDYADQYTLLASEMKEFTSIKKEADKPDPAPSSPSVVHLNVSNSITNPVYTPGSPPIPTAVSPRGVVAPTYEANSLEKGLEIFGKAMLDINNIRQQTLAQMEELVANPIDEFIAKHTAELKEQSKKYAKASTQYDSTVSKFSQLRRSSTTKKFDEGEQDVIEGKKTYRMASIDIVSKLNEIQADKKLLLLERLNTYMFSMKKYFQQGHELLQGLEPYMNDLTTQLNQYRRDFAAEQAKLNESRFNLAVSTPKEANPTPPPTNKEDITCQGYLFMKKKKGNWKRRFFMIEEGKLQFYKDFDKKVKAPRTLDLMVCTVKVSTDTSRNFCFEVISPYESITLQAENQENMNQWIAVLQNATAHSINNNPTTPVLSRQDLRRKKSGDFSGPDSPLPSNRKSPTSSLSSSGSIPGNIGAVESPQMLKILYGLDKKNGFCADCEAEKPDWCSINLGILLCIDCSGIHRSLGTNFSRVRSLTLDTLEPELWQILKLVGNDKANQLYENKYTPSQKVVKATPGCSKDIRTTFITAKYVDKKFVPPYLGLSQEQDLIRFVKTGSIEGVYRLIAQGAEINYQSPNEHKRTALHFAVLAGQPSVVELLIQNGAKVDPQDEKGWAPIHFAVLNKFTNIVALLLKRGATAEVKTNDAKTPYDIALEIQHADLVTLLRLAHLAHEDQNAFNEAVKQFSSNVSAINTAWTS